MIYVWDGSGDSCPGCKRAEAAEAELERVRAERDHWNANCGRVQSHVTYLARERKTTQVRLDRAMAALREAERQASVVHDAIWSKEVASAQVLHDNEREDSAQAAIWRLHDAVRPMLDTESAQ